ncbi:MULTISPECIES: DUF1566 domain-containing protein [unclassified Pseudomonas]|uniref:DUF1566 domain-containing protein n=1 Tax=unclassified Pseudomonas TaxID=196821 RepID=UPI002449E0C6|nr:MULTISPECIES: DUF1566 domain-containing protein [unclassified Pseudomonas]MDG9928301.1 DUF1566 domain-containing protein [Pseudomonas sp. GD04042]MDH0481135.1 DUF1566 domain-containing protein [Pseudomonas sp. GD04015]MDH0604471.1 DUF1566 domain-containing protein [Pseudomonas sp. GD03869]
MQTAAQAAPATALPQIGQTFAGGFVSGFYIQDGKRYASITAPSGHELEGEWGEHGEKIDGAGSMTDSRANTEAMAAAGSELAKRVLALEIGGFNDWAIPARDVQELQYRNLKPTDDANYCWGRDGENHHSVPAGELYTEEMPAQTTVEAFKVGAPEAFAPRWYWSSTQRSAYYAFYMHFEGGYQDISVKSDEFRVRPVRSVLID